MDVDDCPPPPVGGTAECVDGQEGRICVLGCQDAMCPAIMVCEDTGLSTPVCLWP